MNKKYTPHPQISLERLTTMIATADSFKQDCSNVQKKYTLKIKHSSKLRQLGNLFYQHVFFSPWVPWDSLTDLNIFRK